MSAPADNSLGLVMLGGGVAVASALALRTSRDGASVGTAAWIHPVPSLGDRNAVISNEFRASDSDDGKARQHLGVDLMYRRRDARDLIAAFPIGTAGGTRLFFMPERVSALAASAGVVAFAGNTTFGNTVIIRHANGWATYYTHLATLEVRQGASVLAGQAIGTIGASPKDTTHLRHLHFEMWRDGIRSSAVDPAPYLDAWSRTEIQDWIPTPSITPRNAGFAYRPVGSRGEAYPEWVRDLKGKSGVYVIREVDKSGNAETVYVGSSVGRLYSTLTRHFQRVRHEAQEVPMT